MLEQSLYNTEFAQSAPDTAPVVADDLFRGYELKNWDLNPRIYKILAVSSILNLIALAFFATTPVLTAKGCDSPLVGRVCSVLDTVYVGAMLFGTDRQYVDEAYEKTELGDSDITFVDVSNVDAQLQYPGGFVDARTGEEVPMIGQPAVAMLDQSSSPSFPPDMSGFPTNTSGFPSGITTTTPMTGGRLIDTKPTIPKPNPNVLEGDLPTIDDRTGTPDTIATGRDKGRNISRFPTTNPRPVVPKPKPTPEPLPTPMSSDAVKAVEINKKPLTDFADTVSASWDKKEIDLNQDFSVALNGVLTKEGKLDKDKSKFDPSKQKGDPKMIEVGRNALLALADSGYLSYLSALGVDKVNAVLVQDDNQITVVLTSNQKTPERAKTIASGISGAISIGKSTVQNPSDEKTLLDGAKVSAEGNNFVLNFAIPKPVAQEMITRKLKEAQAKKAQPQPNGNAVTKGGSKVGK